MDKIVSCDGGLPWRFTNKAMSAWGGLRLLEEMLRRIGFVRALVQARLPQPGSNRGLDPVTVLQGFLLSVWTGAVRFAHTAAVRFDPCCDRCSLAWKRCRVFRPLRDFFAASGKNRWIWFFGSMSRWFWGQLSPQVLTLDLDSTVLTRYMDSNEDKFSGLIFRFELP